MIWQTKILLMMLIWSLLTSQRARIFKNYKKIIKFKIIKKIKIFWKFKILKLWTFLIMMKDSLNYFIIWAKNLPSNKSMINILIIWSSQIFLKNKIVKLLYKTPWILKYFPFIVIEWARDLLIKMILTNNLQEGNWIPPSKQSISFL